MDIAGRLINLCIDDSAKQDEVCLLMEQHLPNSKVLRLSHPVLHEAAEQRNRRGGGLILWVAWNDARWRALFNDPDYLDKNNRRAWERLRIHEPGLEANRLVQDPDFVEVRHEIYLSFAPKDQIQYYLNWFGGLPKPPLSQQKLTPILERYEDLLIETRLASRAAFSTNSASAVGILEAIWASDQLKPRLVDSLQVLQRSLNECLLYPEHRFRTHLIESIVTWQQL